MIALTFQRPVADARAYVCLSYGAYYSLGYHTGIDIISQEGSCAGWPVVAAAFGVVTYAERVTAPGFTVWGNLVVIRHELPDGQVVYSRSAHVENVLVTKGQTVYPGQHIADIGNADGAYQYHLHYDLSPTNVLATCPWDWPGQDYARVLRDYVDPCSFIREHSQMPTDYTALDAALNNLQAAVSDMQTAVKSFETEPAPLPGVEMVATTNLNVRVTPDTTQPPVATLLKGDVVRCADAVNGWRQIVYGVFSGRYISASYVRPKA